MSGLRFFNFRQGDRSEYLASYFLSGLGLVTPVPRQEDIGFDFYCQLADQEVGALSFGFPFIVQVKSSGSENITYGNPDPAKWKIENISWLFRLELPLVIGIIDKKTMSISFYSTTPLHFISFRSINPSLLELIPRIKETDQVVDMPQTEQISNWQTGKGDGLKYKVDLGNPIITINNDDLHNDEALNKKKEILRFFLTVDQQNLLNRKLGIFHFQWTRKIQTNEDILFAWIFYSPIAQHLVDNMFHTLGPSLISLAISLKVNGKTDLALSLKPILKQIPEHYRPEELTRTNPELFD